MITQILRRGIYFTTELPRTIPSTISVTRTDYYQSLQNIPHFIY